MRGVVFVLMRSRWAAIGAAVAVTMGAGGLSMVAAGGGGSPVTVTVEPERVLDTRFDLGLSGAFVNEVPRELKVTGPVAVASGGTKTVVPEGASAVLVNVTTVVPTDPGFLSLRPGGSTGVPSTSTVNFMPGTVEPNAATVDLGAGGAVQIYVKTASPAGSAHVLLDIVGYTIDHHHDDRYFTKDEVNGLIAGIPGGLAGLVLTEGPVTAVAPTSTWNDFAHLCPAGKGIVSGGIVNTDSNGFTNVFGKPLLLAASHPNNSLDGWVITVYNDTNAIQYYRAYIACADK